MVHLHTCPLDQKTGNRTKYCDVERGFGNHNENRRVASRRNRSWDEPNPSTIGQSDTPTVGYQEG